MTLESKKNANAAARGPSISLPVLAIACALVATALVPLAIGNDLTKAHAHVVLAAFVGLGFLGCNRFRDLFSFLSPNALIFFYASVSMALGAWGFSNGFVLRAADVADYNGWQSMHVSLTFIMLALSILLIVDFQYLPRYRALAFRARPRCGSVHLTAAALVLPLFLFPFDLAWLGGSGDFSIIGRQAVAMVLILYATRFQAATRWALYLALLAFFAAFAIDDKRQALLLVVPMLYLEFLQSPRRFSIKTIAASALLGAFLMSLILAMSIARGYGGFGAFDDLLDAAPFVVAYMRSEIFVSALLNNIEANYFFFHAVNSIEMVLRDPQLIAFGETIIKFVFVIFPRAVVEWKPDSMITLYTIARDPVVREMGGSWPIAVVSELYWNFSYFALIAVVGLALLLAKLQFAVLRAHRDGRTFYLAFLMCAHMNVLLLARGSGTDLYFVYAAIAAVAIFVCAVMAAMLRRVAVGRSVESA